MPRSGGFLVDDKTIDNKLIALPLAFYHIFLFHKPTRPSCLQMQWFTSQSSVHVFDMGDRLLQRGTIYGAHRMSGGTIYDDTSGPGGPLVQGDQLTRYSPTQLPIAMLACSVNARIMKQAYGIALTSERIIYAVAMYAVEINFTNTVFDYSVYPPPKL